MPIGLGRARRRYNSIRKRRIAHGPLKRLLRSHRKANNRLNVCDLEFFKQQPVNGFDIVANGHRGEARAVEGFGRVAGR